MDGLSISEILKEISEIDKVFKQQEALEKTLDDAERVQRQRILGFVYKESKNLTIVLPDLTNDDYSWLFLKHISSKHRKHKQDCQRRKSNLKRIQLQKRPKFPDLLKKKKKKQTRSSYAWQIKLCKAYIAHIHKTKENARKRALKKQEQ